MGRRHSRTDRWKLLIDRLHQERVAAGVTQTDVAAWLGVSPSMVSEWEAGIVHPGVGTIVDWAELFGLRLDFVDAGRG